MFGFRIFPSRRLPIPNAKRRQKARRRIENLHEACAPWAAFGSIEEIERESTKHANTLPRPTKNQARLIVAAALRIAQDYERMLDEVEEFVEHKDDPPIVKRR